MNPWTAHLSRYFLPRILLKLLLIMLRLSTIIMQYSDKHINPLLPRTAPQRICRSISDFVKRLIKSKANWEYFYLMISLSQKYAMRKFKDLYGPLPFLNFSARHKMLENFLFRLTKLEETWWSHAPKWLSKSTAIATWHCSLSLTKNSRACVWLIQHSRIAIQSRKISRTRGS